MNNFILLDYVKKVI